MSESRLFAVQSWSELFQMLRAKAEVSRGTVTIAANGSASTSWPHTTARDAFAIALVFDSVIDAHASGEIVARWIVESDLLAGEPEDSTEPYVGNRSFWETLAAVTIELDRVQAPLPTRSAIDEAMRELEAVRTSAPRDVGNAGGTMLVTVFTEPTWRAMGLRQLDFFRVLRGEAPGINPVAPRVPATHNADVLALVDYWTEQLDHSGERASDTYHRLLYSCWRETVDRVRRDAKDAPGHERCKHNAAFWASLLLLTTQSDACNTRPLPWAFYVPESCQSHRNAAPVETAATIEFPAARTWDDAARMQRDEFLRLRGHDVVTGRLISYVPRTTIADVRQLAAYWSASLAKVGEHHPADVSYRHVVDRWKAALAEVSRIPSDVDPSSVYAHNTEFWEALMTIAVQVAVTAEAPSRWQYIKEATVQAVKDLPHTLQTATQRLVSDVLARPLASIGIGLGGIALAYLVLRRTGHESRP